MRWTHDPMVIQCIRNGRLWDGLLGAIRERSTRQLHGSGSGAKSLAFRHVTVERSASDTELRSPNNAHLGKPPCGRIAQAWSLP